MDDTREPPCVVEGLTHAFVPAQRQLDGYLRATCGRCALVRVQHPSGFLSYWKSAKLQPQD